MNDGISCARDVRFASLHKYNCKSNANVYDDAALTANTCEYLQIDDCIQT